MMIVIAGSLIGFTIACIISYVMRTSERARRKEYKLDHARKRKEYFNKYHIQYRGRKDL